jgi:hypothetical protein
MVGDTLPSRRMVWLGQKNQRIIVRLVNDVWYYLLDEDDTHILTMDNDHHYWIQE